MSFFPKLQKENLLVEKTKYRFDTTYIIKKLLGSGSSGGVYTALSIKDHTEYAIKKIDMRHFKRRDEYRRQVHEINILFFNRNPFLLHAIDLEYRKDDCRLDITTELFNGGNLDEFIRKYRINGKKIPDCLIWKIFLQCCLGIKYLHLNNIIHRDIKPQNILLDNREFPNHVVISDFGASICLHEQNEFCITKIGTPYFMSPEINHSSKYNKKTDIWSLGCILYEMITLEKPFTAANVVLLNNKINKGIFKPIGCIDNHNYIIWNSIITSLLEKNPDERPSITSIIELPTIRKKIIEMNITIEKHQAFEIPKVLVNRIIPNSASFCVYTLDLYNEINISKNKTVLDDIRIEYAPSPIKFISGRPASDNRLLPKITRQIYSENLENIRKPFPLKLRDRVSAFRLYQNDEC